ncbi:11006_t:CDS:2, partial [Dentiscutata heterogama]
MGKLNLLFGKKKRSNDNENPVTPIPSTLTKNGTPKLSLEYPKSDFIIPVPKAISPLPSVQTQKEQKTDVLLNEILSELSLVGTKWSNPH